MVPTFDLTHIRLLILLKWWRMVANAFENQRHGLKDVLMLHLQRKGSQEGKEADQKAITVSWEFQMVVFWIRDALDSGIRLAPNS